MGTDGYDSPIRDQSTDLLDRSAFARELTNLVCDSPIEWSIRIGVYGRWGEGKTSVIRLCQEIFSAAGHFIVDFNPWGCRNTEEMIEVLARSIQSAVAGTSIQLPNRRSSWLRRQTGKVGRFLKGAEKATTLAPSPVKIAAALASHASPWLERWARLKQDDIAQISNAVTSGKRIVVFVDDVDRVNPKLLPDLLFALHDVFAIPGVSFIVALDPEVVGAALQEYHRGFGSGEEFLQKIVQFPRWLPRLTTKDLLRVGETDRAKYAPFVSPSILAANQSILPTNPRELRTAIRGLGSLKRAVSRHDADELDQRLLLTLACFRQRFPRTFLRILHEDDFLRRSRLSAVDSNSATSLVALVKEIAVECGEMRTDEVGEPLRRLEQLLAEFGRDLTWDERKIVYHAELIEKPHAITWREFRTLIASAPPNVELLDSWVSSHALSVNQTEHEVATELIATLITSYDEQMAKAAGMGTAESHARHLTLCHDHLSILRMLWLSSSYRSSTATPARFAKALAVFCRWAHFDLNLPDRNLRTLEKDLAVDIASNVEDVAACLAELAPWDSEVDDNEQAAASLSDGVVSVLVNRAEAIALDQFLEPGAIGGFFRPVPSVWDYLLVQATPTWSAAGRQKFVELAIKSPQIVAENLRTFVKALNNSPNFRTDIDRLLSDRDLVEMWWRTIVAVAWQKRFFSALQEVKASLERDRPLPAPLWWEGPHATPDTYTELTPE